MNIEIIKSFRKTLSVQVKNGIVIVKAPIFMTKKSINTFIDKHKTWINDKLKNKKKSIIDNSKISEYKKKAKKYIPNRTIEVAKQYQIKFNTIKITSAKTRWGSCTSKRNLNFSYRLILCPEKVIDYVICHELAHLKEMNHSKKFRREVERLMPDYKEHNKWLKDNASIF